MIILNKYKKLYFICTSNSFLSPLSEEIYRVKMKENMPEPFSRGLVILFPEPLSPKVNQLLYQNDLTSSRHEYTRQLENADLEKDVLFITMTLSEKVQFMEQFGDEYDVFTLGEFTGEETDVADPYGLDSNAYEACFEDLNRRIDLLIDRINGMEG